MIEFLTILYVLFPDGERVTVLAEYPSAYECGEAIDDFAKQDLLDAGYSFHCHMTSEMTRSPRPVARN